jgi:hypothetical protein
MMVGIGMRRAALLLVFIFLASCLFFVKPASSNTYIGGNSWVSKAPMHEDRANLGVAVVDGRIYAIGGNNKYAVLDTNEMYDPETDAWTVKAPMPVPINSFGVAVFQGKIYCIGEDVNEVYDPVADVWETKAPMPTYRYGLQANVVDGKIYLIGGVVPDKNEGCGFSFVTVNEVYDPVADSWATKAPKPVATGSVASVTIDKKIYVIGGIASSTGCLNQVYDPVADSWSQCAVPPSGVGYGVAGATTGVDAPKRIYFFYGNGVQYYDPLSDSYGFGAGMITGRSYPAVAVLNDKLYVVGGYIITFPPNFLTEPLGSNPIITYSAAVEVYTPFGYGTVPPAVQVISLEDNVSYSGAGVVLNFTLNKPASWIGYSLDGQDNVTVAGNVTLSGLSYGWHNLTVYAEDSLGNMGASETVHFNVASSLTTVVAVASGASAIAVAAGLLVYFKKFKKRTAGAT